MHQDIIQNFLNIPDVLGIALMQGRVIPYFYIKEQIFSSEKRIDLIRSFRKNVLEVPGLSNALEFQLDDYYAYTFKLNDTLTLLAISHQKSSIVQSMANKILKSAFQEDVDITVKSFESLTKKVLHSPLPKPVISDKLNSEKKNAAQFTEELYSIEECVVTLNDLSQFVCNYLGPKITSNFWIMTRPGREWLSNFQIKSSAKIEFLGSVQTSVSPLQHLFIREWTNAFMNQCSQIIKDLPSRVDQDFLNKKQRKMISIMPHGHLNEISSLSAEDQQLFK